MRAAASAVPGVAPNRKTERPRRAAARREQRRDVLHPAHRQLVRLGDEQLRRRSALRELDLETIGELGADHDGRGPGEVEAAVRRVVGAGAGKGGGPPRGSQRLTILEKVEAKSTL